MSKRQLVLQLLDAAGERGVTTAEFIQAGCGSRFGARVQELRDAGFRVDARRLRAGSHLYTLRSAPQPQASPAEAAVARLPLFTPAPADALCWDGEAA